MRALIYIALFALLGISTLNAQVKIGENPQNIDPFSILELESGSKALVITRIGDAEMAGMTPLRGALVYNTDQGCVFYYDGTEWSNLCDDTTNIGLELNGSELVLTDSAGNTVSVTLDGAIQQTFTTDPIINFRESIVITQNGNNFNFEVSEITGDNIVDSSINGIDLQDNSITANKLAPNSVGQEELQDNTVSDLEIDYGQVTLNDFFNDAGFITGAQLISPNPGNVIIDAGGAFYDDSLLQSSVANNTQQLSEHLANDNDLDPENERLTNVEIDGTELVLTEGPIVTRVDLSSFNNPGTDDQNLTLNGNRIEIEDGNGVDLSAILGDANTDDQNLTLNGTQIEIEDGNTIDLAPILGDANTDNQQLTLNGNLLTLEDGGTPIDLTPFAGTGTDNQNISTDGNPGNISIDNGDTITLNVEDGDSDAQNEIQDAVDVDINPITGIIGGNVQLALEELQTDIDNLISGGGADGVVSNVALAGSNLNFTGANGGFNGTVDLSGLSGTNDGVVTDVQLAGNNLNFTGAGGGFTGSIDLSGLSGTNDGVVSNVTLTGTTLNFTGTNGGFNGPINLAGLNTDAQGLSLTGNTLNISGGTGVDLTPILGGTNTDEQELNLVGDILGIDNGNTVDLSTIDNQIAAEVPFAPTGNTVSNNVQDAIVELQTEIDGITVAGGGNPTDELQVLQLTGNILTLNPPATPDNPIDLTPYLDDQNAGEVPVAATPTNYTATTADVEAHLAGIDAALGAGGGNPTDEIQDLQLATDILTITNNATATPIDLSVYLDNTDEQQADAVPVTATPANYTPASGFVEGHLAGIDAVLATAGGNPTDEIQDLQLATDILTITNNAAATPIDLSIYLDNTDEQQADAVPVTATPTNYTPASAFVEGHLAGIDAVLATVGTTELADQTTIIGDGTVGNEFEVADGGITAVKLNQMGATLNQVLIWDGTQWTPSPQAIDPLELDDILAEGNSANNITITDLPPPNLDSDAATKQYVDNEIDDLINNELAGLEAEDIGFDPSTSSLTAGDVQAALEELAGTTNTNMAENDLTLTAARTHNLNGNNFVLDGAGNVGIGNLPGAPQSKLDVDGQIQARNGFAANIGSANQPSYGFSTETNLGMYRAGVSQLGFSTGGSEAMRIGATQTVTIAQSLELDGTLMDINGEVGTSGQILSSTGAGVDWIDAPGSLTIVSGDGGNLITAGTDGGALLTSVNDGDFDPGNEIELPVGGNNGQILSTDGFGNYTWVDDQSTAGTIVSGDGGNLITAGTDGGALLTSVNDGDFDPGNEIELPVGGNNGQILSTDGFGNYTWVDDQSTAGTIVSGDGGNLITAGTDGGALLTSVNDGDFDPGNEIELPVGGNNGQILSTDGFGNYTWVDDQSTAGTIVSGDGGNLITAGTDGGALLTSVNDGDFDPGNEIELPVGGNNGQILSTDGFGNYTWVDDQSTAGTIVSGDGGNLITAGTDGGALLTSVNDGDFDPGNEIELPVGGNNGQILSTDGFGNYTWVDDQSTAGTIVSGDGGNLITAGTDGGALLTSVNDGDFDPGNEIELPVGGNNGQILSTDGFGNYTWVDDQSSAGTIVSGDGGNIISTGSDGGALLNQITTAQITDGAINSAKIGDGTIEGNDLSAMGAIGAGPVLRFNGSNWAAQEIGLNATAGSIFFSNGGLLGQSNAQLFWDNGSSELGVGTNNPNAKLHVVGNSIFVGTVVINGTDVTPDYVFQKYFNGFSELKPNYKRLSLNEVEEFAKKHNHLPGIPSASEISRNGLEVNRALFNHLEKIEELFLYTIEQEKKIKLLKEENQKLAEEVEAMKKDMALIKELLAQKAGN